MINKITLAHERLQSILPARTHYAKPPEERRPQIRRCRSRALYLYERVRALKAEGHSRLEIVRRLGVSGVTVTKYSKMTQAPE